MKQGDLFAQETVIEHYMPPREIVNRDYKALRRNGMSGSNAMIRALQGARTNDLLSADDAQKAWDEWRLSLGPVPHEAGMREAKANPPLMTIRLQTESPGLWEAFENGQPVGQYLSRADAERYVRKRLAEIGRRGY